MADDNWFLVVLGLLGVGALIYLVLGNRPQSAALPQSAPLPSVAINNEEKWQWVDWQGRSREIIVHRDVRQVG
jgi:hypothetical protein